MRRPQFQFLFVGALLTVIAAGAAADDAKDEAIKKDHRLIEGMWRIVAIEVDGNKSTEEDARKLTVVNGSDGAWSLRSEGREIGRGVSSIDPVKTSRTIDITPTEGGGKGDLHLGIYELDENTRKLCFAPPGKQRPTEFSSTPGSEHILVTFEREKDDRIKRDRQRIEGSWTVVAMDVNGAKTKENDAGQLKVVIGADGTWSLNSGEKEAARGTCTIDPTKKPKSIDFTVTVGEDKGKQSLGIYEVGEDTLTFCVAPSGKERPTEFSSTPGNEHILITFEPGKIK